MAIPAPSSRRININVVIFRSDSSDLSAAKEALVFRAQLVRAACHDKCVEEPHTPEISIAYTARMQDLYLRAITFLVHSCS